MGVPKRIQRKSVDNLFKEIMAENFPDLKEGKKMPSYRRTEGPQEDELEERPTLRHIIKMEKVKARILKAVRAKQITGEAPPINISSDLSIQSL